MRIVGGVYETRRETRRNNVTSNRTVYVYIKKKKPTFGLHYGIIGIYRQIRYGLIARKSFICIKKSNRIRLASSWSRRVTLWGHPVCTRTHIYEYTRAYRITGPSCRAAVAALGRASGGRAAVSGGGRVRFHGLAATRPRYCLLEVRPRSRENSEKIAQYFSKTDGRTTRVCLGVRACPVVPPAERTRSVLPS